MSGDATGGTGGRGTGAGGTGGTGGTGGGGEAGGAGRARRVFGAGGPRLPVVGQGTWQMEHDGRAAEDALRLGLDLGLTVIDTAEMYGRGAVEELVGRALAGRRDEAFLVSKVLPSNASRRGTREACARSLSRLGTDRLDLYLLHWPGEHPLEETFAAFEELRERGDVRAWGVSNFDAHELRTAQALIGRGDGRPADGRLVCNQVLYHLEQRAVEHEVLDACARAGAALQAYSPLGQGRLPDPASPGGRVLGRIAADHGVAPGAVALRFLLDGPPGAPPESRPVFVIPKATRPGHLRANAAALDLVLTDDERARLDAAFPPGGPPAHLPML